MSVLVELLAVLFLAGLMHRFVGEVDTEFSTNIETFVNIEVYTGEDAEVEVGRTDFAVGGVLPVFFNYFLRGVPLLGGASVAFEAYAYLYACIYVKTTFGNEVTLVAEVDVEAAATGVVVKGYVVVFGSLEVGVVDVLVHAETDVQADSVLIGDEVAAGKTILAIAEGCVVVRERIELEFNTEVALLGCKFVLCDSGRSDGCNEGSCKNKLFHCCVLYKDKIKTLVSLKIC